MRRLPMPALRVSKSAASFARAGFTFSSPAREAITGDTAISPGTFLPSSTSLAVNLKVIYGTLKGYLFILQSRHPEKQEKQAFLACFS